VRREAKRVAGLKVSMDKTKVLLPLGPDGRPYDLDMLVLPEGLPTDPKLVVDGNIAEQDGWRARARTPSSERSRQTRWNCSRSA
jgi:hypothetical protein